jgi:hypothetical protein
VVGSGKFPERLSRQSVGLLIRSSLQTSVTVSSCRASSASSRDLRRRVVPFSRIPLTPVGRSSLWELKSSPRGERAVRRGLCPSTANASSPSRTLLGVRVPPFFVCGLLWLEFIRLSVWRACDCTEIARSRARRIAIPSQLAPRAVVKTDLVVVPVRSLLPAPALCGRANARYQSGASLPRSV